MPFIEIKGVKGLVWEPEACGAKKHKCRDCHSCQWCSDERCTLCLRERKKKYKKKKEKAKRRRHRT